MRLVLISLIFLSAELSAGGLEHAFIQKPQTTRQGGPPPDPEKPTPGVVGIPGRVPVPVAPGQTQPAGSPATAGAPGRGATPPSLPGQTPPPPNQPVVRQSTTPAPATRSPTPTRAGSSSDGGIMLSFTNAPLENVISTIMDELGYTYVIDPSVSGNVSLYTREQIPRDRLFPVLEQLLNMNRQAIVKQEDFYVILPIDQSPKIPGTILVRPGTTQRSPPPATPPTGAVEQPPAAAAQPPATPPVTPGQQAVPAQPTAGQQPPTAPPGAVQGTPPVLTLGEAPESAQLDQVEGVITYIIPLHYIPSSDMVTMAQAFISEGAQVVDFQSANMIILTDYRANVEQVLNLIHLLDTRYFDLNAVDLVPIRFNQATDVAEDLGQIFAPGDRAAGVRIVAIERLNSLLIVTHSPQVFAEVKRWIDKLDAPSTATNVKTYVYQVENNTAANIAEIMAQLYEDGAGLPSGPPSEAQSAQSLQDRRQPEQQAGFLPEGNRRQGSGFGPSLGGRSASSGVRAVVSGNIKIIVNEFNNSLIIQSTEADYQFLEETIKLLDVLPRQVLIEARIYSVELRNDLSYGISTFMQQLMPGDDGTFPPATTGSVSSSSGGGTGGSLSLATRIMLGGERQVDILLAALRTRTNVEILEAPSLLVIDGTEAEINVGAEVPVTTASFGNPLQAGNTSFVNSINFRPTGTTLIMLPRISASGIVTLDLAIEISNATGDALTPTINRNYVQTSLIARDHQTVAIAGVISDSNSLSTSRVPLLGDIPILGALFGQTDKRKRRFELLFLITPKVIRNLPTAVELTLDFQRALQNAYGYINRKEREDEELRQRRRKEELEQLQQEQNTANPPPKPPESR